MKRNTHDIMQFVGSICVCLILAFDSFTCQSLSSDNTITTPAAILKTKLDTITSETNSSFLSTTSTTEIPSLLITTTTTTTTTTSTTTTTPKIVIFTQSDVEKKRHHGKKELNDYSQTSSVIGRKGALDRSSAVQPRKGVLDSNILPSVPKKGVEQDFPVTTDGKVKPRKGVEGDMEINSDSKNQTNVLFVEEPVHTVTKESTAKASLDSSVLVGATFAIILLVVVGIAAFRKLDAIRRRREYRRMNDFLIDGMYNDL